MVTQMTPQQIADLLIRTADDGSPYDRNSRFSEEEFNVLCEAARLIKAAHPTSAEAAPVNETVLELMNVQRAFAVDSRTRRILQGVIDDYRWIANFCRGETCLMTVRPGTLFELVYQRAERDAAALSPQPTQEKP